MKEENKEILKVAIVEDDVKIRKTYLALLEEEEKIKCVGDFSCCEDLLKVLDKIKPDVVLMDIGLPGMSGIEGIQCIKSLCPSIEVIMLTIYDDNEKIFNSLLVGAGGYILKNTRPQELIEAILQIKSGAPMSPPIARRVLNYFRANNQVVEDDYNLTSRETDILKLLVEGLSYKKIAEQLYISPLTVHSHIKKIYEKLQVHSKAEAISKALKHKLY